MTQAPGRCLCNIPTNMPLLNHAKKLLVPVMASRAMSSVARRFIGNGIPVFMLHRMAHQNAGGTNLPEHLRRCLGYLVEHDYTFLSLERYVHALINRQTLPERAVVFTMDDGYRDQAEIAAPIFIEYGCPLTFFIISGMLDREIWPWDAQLAWIISNSPEETLATGVTGRPERYSLDSHANKRRTRHALLDIFREADAEHVPAMLQQLALDASVALPEQAPEEYAPMDWNMARALEHRGIRFAPHSMTHKTLSRVNDDTSRDEILGSWHALKNKLDNPLKLFCYPTGRDRDYTEREVRILGENGFLGAVSTIPGFAELARNNAQLQFNLPRLALPDTMEDFIQYCSWIEYAKERFRKSAPGTST